MPCCDIEECLTFLGIEKQKIIPTKFSNELSIWNKNVCQFSSEFNIFPLEWFDGTDGTEGNLEFKEVAAFIPDSHSDSTTKFPDNFQWRQVIVQNFNENNKKWNVKDIQSEYFHEVPRIYIWKTSEDPFIQARRMQQATIFRDECEMTLKFEALIDNISMNEYPKPSRKVHEKIRKKLSSPFNVRWIKLFEMEQVILYQKAQARLEAKVLIQKCPQIFPSIRLPVTLSEEKQMQHFAMRTAKEKKSSKFSQLLQTLQRTWLFCCPQAIHIIKSVNLICDDISVMTLFEVSDKVLFLEEFLEIQDMKFLSMEDFLIRSMIKSIVDVVKCQLLNVKGWFDLNVHDWNIYKMSKTSRIIELIKQRMEIALKIMLRSSLQNFVSYLCEPCEKILNVPLDFKWGNDLIFSTFHSENAVFALDLVLENDNEPIYTNNIENYGEIIIELLKSRILLTHDIPEIDSFLINLKFDRSLRLSSVGLMDEEIQKQFQLIQICYEKCKIPLLAYAREFRKFIEYKYLNIEEYVQSLRDNDSDLIFLGDEILRHRKSIKMIETSLPTSIVIGPFKVNVSEIKMNLISKRNALNDALLNSFFEQLHEKLDKFKDEYLIILEKLGGKNESIEELIDVKKWIQTLPQQLDEIAKNVKELSPIYNTLDSLSMPLPQDILKLKIFSMTSPIKILRKAEGLEKQQQFDYDQFKKLQAMDVGQFMDQVERVLVEIESINSECQSGNSIDEKDLKVKLQHFNGIITRRNQLNNRQIIFNNPELELNRLNDLVDQLKSFSDGQHLDDS
ncbi:CLUMA_CG008007, isoform A [Clunio marinus]|uniref:CLUMA_CG008007, isoform A n=1 Tax=Clunio marinus TaxID=568069 RepID=A0A1J1I6D6_9DIPT|nr:CLUMA_CG008007, isoform A [Clunio marinus]